MSASSGGRPSDETRSGAALPLQALLAAIDGHVGDAHLRERFGDLGAAFPAALGSWVEPFAAAVQGLEPTAYSQAAARAFTDIARLTGSFARDAAQRLEGERTDRTASGGYDRYAELAGRIDDSFRDFSSSPEFDRARRSAAAALLDWLEHDRATASSIARALDPSPELARAQSGESMPSDTEAILRDGTATLIAYPSTAQPRASVLLIPGFTLGARAFDLDPQHSTARSLAKHGVDTWLLDWGRPDETDRLRTVADQLERIDRALDAMREASSGRHPALAGHFHGGLLALLYCIRHPGKAGAVVTLSTPVEFASGDDAFAAWLRACDGERLVDVFGNIPGPIVAALTAAASPVRWCGGGFLALLGALDSALGTARLARFELARRSPPAFPGETFRGLYRTFYRDNAFIAGAGAVLDGHRYELSSLAIPILNVFGRDDRIVPASAAAPLAALAQAASCSAREYHGGHFDLLTSHRAHTELLPDIAAWLIERVGEP